MHERPIAAIIDDLLAAKKTLIGSPVWQNPYSSSEDRLLLPLQVDGVSTGADLTISAYPNIRPLSYRMMICAPKCIWRVDYVYDEHHINSFERPIDLKEFSFCEPHYHAWPDNRHFCTYSTLPDRLPNARIMPNLRSFDSCLRWLCGETNIEQPPCGLIDLPPRRVLL